MTETGGKPVAQNLDYALGGLDARVTLLERGMKDMQREIKESLQTIGLKNDQQSDKIDKLTQAMVASRSSWKTIGWFVGIVAGLSAVIGALSQMGIIR